MVALATGSIDRFRTSTIEVDALEKRYTVQTLEAMKRHVSGAQLLFIIGTDMYQEIETWKRLPKTLRTGPPRDREPSGISLP